MKARNQRNHHASDSLACCDMGLVKTCDTAFAVIGIIAGYSGESPLAGKTRMMVWKGFAFLLGTMISMSIICAFWGFIMPTTFTIGFGLPLTAMIVGIGLDLGKISKTLSLVVTIVKYVGGVALVGSGFYLLFTF